MKAEFFRRLDESEDAEFYRSPRRVVHIDDSAIAEVRKIYEEFLRPQTAILDLMSSWRSHLPAGFDFQRVVGLGLNREEMQDNPALSEIVVHDVNRQPQLPFADGSFDAVVMTVSVQYLVRPLEVFAEVSRVLRPSAPCIVVFSNRMFPTKAIALWQAANAVQRTQIVSSYFAQSNGFTGSIVVDRSVRREPGDPIWAVYARAKHPEGADL